MRWLIRDQCLTDVQSDTSWWEDLPDLLSVLCSRLSLNYSSLYQSAKFVPRHTHCIHLIIPAVADACFSIRCALGAMTFRPNPWRHLWKQISNRPESLGRNETKRGKAKEWFWQEIRHIYHEEKREGPKSNLIVQSRAYHTRHMHAEKPSFL